jgi:hypothetical protein
MPFQEVAAWAVALVPGRGANEKVSATRKASNMIRAICFREIARIVSSISKEQLCLLLSVYVKKS